MMRPPPLVLDAKMETPGTPPNIPGRIQKATVSVEKLKLKLQKQKGNSFIQTLLVFRNYRGSQTH